MLSYKQIKNLSIITFGKKDAWIDFICKKYNKTRADIKRIESDGKIIWR